MLIHLFECLSSSPEDNNNRALAFLFSNDAMFWFPLLVIPLLETSKPLVLFFLAFSSVHCLS